MSKRHANAVKLKIEHLLAAKIAGHPPDDDIMRWVAGLRGSHLAQQLAKHGLIPHRESTSLGEFLEAYFARRADVKNSTQVNWRHTKRNLLAFFGADRSLSEITTGDAKDFERYLKTEARENRYVDKTAADGLSTETVRKRISNAKQFFQDAFERELIRKNPFTGLKSATQGNPDRFFFVTQEITDKVFDACPDCEWRLIFALARYGGLRVPSEILRLRLDDIVWDRVRFLVHAPKTECYDGKATRWVPIFGELRPYLVEAWELAKPGQEYFILRGRENSGAYFRTMFMKIIRRAGLDVWPKLWQNLRSTRQTELEDRFKEYMVCAWLGNSAQVARKHYLQITDEHFEQAANGAAESSAVALQKAVQQPAADQNEDMEGVVESQENKANEPDMPPSAVTCRPNRWAYMDSNHGPRRYQRRALTN